MVVRRTVVVEVAHRRTAVAARHQDRSLRVDQDLAEARHIREVETLVADSSNI